MHPPLALLAGAAFVALLLGLLLGWIAANGRASGLAQAAASEARLSTQVEMATLTERLAATSAALQSERQQYAALRQEAQASRHELDLASNEIAKLTERSSRVPALEAESTALAAAVEGREAQLQQRLDAAKDELTVLRESSGTETSRLCAELAAERGALALVRQELSELRVAKEVLDNKFTGLTTDLTELRTRTGEERQHAAEKLQLLAQAKDALTHQFKSLAADILEEKSKRFAEQNQKNIGQLLEPLKAQLSEFKGKVEEVYVQEGKDRSALSEQVRQLVTLNHAISQDAKNLTVALKGQVKVQGSWGELILERVLEAAGLKKGQEYKVQDSQAREDGTRAQPDVVIELPEERKLVVDAKVSLVAYERYVSAASDEERAVAVRQHMNSVRAHIKGLSEKQYHALYGLQSLDFVIAFVPVEPAFMLAVTHDNELFMEAWQRNVLLVSPSTLLFVVRTVAHLWRQESQGRNAQEIAKRGAELYDKLCGFVADLQKVGERLDQAKAAYDEAHGKLASGKGNAIRQAQMLRDLGVKPSKALPAQLVQAATGDSDIVIPNLAALAPPTRGGAADSAQALPAS